MTDNSGIFIEDLEWISQADLPWEKLDRVEELKKEIQQEHLM